MLHKEMNQERLFMAHLTFGKQPTFESADTFKKFRI
jgi:hypothetical protein